MPLGKARISLVQDTEVVERSHTDQMRQALVQTGVNTGGSEEVKSHTENGSADETPNGYVVGTSELLQICFPHCVTCRSTCRSTWSTQACDPPLLHSISVHRHSTAFQTSKFEHTTPVAEITRPAFLLFNGSRATDGGRLAIRADIEIT